MLLLIRRRNRLADMATSINGWEVLGSPPWDDKRLTRLRVPGTPCVFYGRASVAPLFVSLALDYHKTIHPLVNKTDVDSYDYRIARASSSYSDHASGTATDLRASAEGAQGTSTYNWWVGAKSAAARVIKARYEIVIWGGPRDLGGDYGNPRYYDAMHWALKPGTTQADVNRMIAKLGIRSDGTRTGTPTVVPVPPKPGTRPTVSVANVQPGKKNSQIALVQKALIAEKISVGASGADGAFGPATLKAYSVWQQRLGYAGAAADGKPGQTSLTKLGVKHGFAVVA